MVYENLKKIAIKRFGSERNIPFSSIFLMSSIGKIMATLVTYPILTVRVRLQADTGTEGGKFNKIVNELKHLGVFGLYRGLQAKIIQTVLNNAFLMMTYEKLRGLIKILLFKSFYKPILA